MSVELRFGDSTVMLADEFPEMGIVSPQTLGGTYMALHLMVDDVDRVWQRALDAGAEVFHPLQDSFWGERHGQVIDPFGHRWGLAQHLRDVSPEELVRAAPARCFHRAKMHERRRRARAGVPRRALCDVSPRHARLDAPRLVGEEPLGDQAPR